MNPGKRVSGMSKSACGRIKLNQLNSPITASTNPNTMSHLGKSFKNVAGMA
jgi:hypothetical protein